MELSEVPQSSLRRLIDLAHERAAAALNQLTDQAFFLVRPEISIARRTAVAPLLSQLTAGTMATVNQEFAGPIAGNAILMLDGKAVQFVTDCFAVAEADSISFGEIVTEFGNILLNAYLGVFGNELRVALSFSVPEVRMRSESAGLSGLSGPAASQEDVLIIGTEVKGSGNSQGGGKLAVVMGLAPIDRLEEYLRCWEKGLPSTERDAAGSS